MPWLYAGCRRRCRASRGEQYGSERRSGDGIRRCGRRDHRIGDRSGRSWCCDRRGYGAVIRECRGLELRWLLVLSAATAIRCDLPAVHVLARQQGAGAIRLSRAASRLPTGLRSTGLPRPAAVLLSAATRLKRDRDRDKAACYWQVVPGGRNTSRVIAFVCVTPSTVYAKLAAFPSLKVKVAVPAGVAMTLCGLNGTALNGGPVVR